MSLESILTIGGLEQRRVDGRERARDQGENEEDCLERERENPNSNKSGQIRTKNDIGANYLI